MIIILLATMALLGCKNTKSDFSSNIYFENISNKISE